MSCSNDFAAEVAQQTQAKKKEEAPKKEEMLMGEGRAGVSWTGFSYGGVGGERRVCGTGRELQCMLALGKRNPREEGRCSSTFSHVGQA